MEFSNCCSNSLQKSEISPHDRFFSTDTICDICDKYGHWNQLNTNSFCQMRMWMRMSMRLRMRIQFPTNQKVYILIKYESDFKKYPNYEDEIYKNMLFFLLCVCLFVCLLVCLFVWLFDLCHKNDLNYKLNILGPLCLWQCFFDSSLILL